jgi:hypothetical protein
MSGNGITSKSGPPGRAARVELANEFAHVTLETVETGNGVRLRLRDNRTQRAIDLDPMVLSALVWLTESDLDHIVDPQFAIESGVRSERASAAIFGKTDLAENRS